MASACVGRMHAHMCLVPHLKKTLFSGVKKTDLFFFFFSSQLLHLFRCQREISFHRRKYFQTSVLANQGPVRALAFLFSRVQSRNLVTGWPGQMIELRCALIWQKDNRSFPPAAEVFLMQLCGHGQDSYPLWGPGVCLECEG